MRSGRARRSSASQARCPDDGAFGERREGIVAAADEGVAGVGAQRNGAENEALGHVGGEILDAVNGDVDVREQQGALDLLDEEAFTADGGERAVEDAVALSGDGDELDLEAGVRVDEALANVAGLPEGERAGAGADT